ncbi:MAG: hypothetical protein FWB91_09655 [Defluviitaleaceae bacterium]|nr:hypothetical protein [Defluviitaleaceae bacterium]
MKKTYVLGLFAAFALGVLVTVGVMNIPFSFAHDSDDIDAIRFTWADAFESGNEARIRSARLATEAAIEDLLRAIPGILNASVSLNISQPLAVGALSPSASVVIRAEEDFSYDNGYNIALILTRAVNGLEMENVIIVDQYAQTVFSYN